MFKASFLAIVVVAASIKIQAQGVINFANIGAGLNAPVFDVDGATKLAGPAFQAQVYVGSSTDESSLTAVSPKEPFLSNGGYFNAGTRAVPGFPPGSRPFFQVRVWEAAGGASYDAAMTAGAKYGKSTVFQFADTGGLAGPGPPGGPPPVLLGLTSFSLVPEPSAVALGAVGGAILLLLRRVSKTMRRSMSL